MTRKVSEEKTKTPEFKTNWLKKRMTIGIRTRKKPSLRLLTVITIVLAFVYLAVGNEWFVKAEKPVQYVSQKTNHGKVTFTGDVSPSRYLKKVTKKKGAGIYYDNVKQVWQDSDVSIVNLEAAVVESVDKYKDFVVRMDRKKIYLDVNQADVQALKDAGVSLIGYANNHSLDYGIPGLFETLEIFKKLNVDYTGAGYNIDDAKKPYLFELNGKKTSLTAINHRPIPKKDRIGSNLPRIHMGTYYYADYEMAQTFKENDINIVYAHWGTEYAIKPDKEIRELGRHYIDMGADLVVASHPHVLHPVEKYKDGLIVYSLGNLVFDQEIGRTTDSAIANFYINDKERFMEFVPIVINKGIPRIVDDEKDVKRILGHLTKMLKEGDYKIENGKLRVDF